MSSNIAEAPSFGKVGSGDNESEMLHAFVHRLRRGAIGIHRFRAGHYVDLTSWRVNECGICIRSSVRVISLPAVLTPHLVLGFKEAHHRLEHLVEHQLSAGAL